MGKHLCRRLLKEGRGVVVLDLAPLPADLAEAGAKGVRGSITSPADVAQAVAGCDAVVHLAAKVSDYGRPRDFQALNVDATRLVCAEAEQAGVSRLVHMSSLAVFDYRVGYRDADEETPTGGHEYDYGKTKLLAEGVVRACGLPAVIVRPGLFPYGPEAPVTVDPILDAVERRLPLLVSGGRAVLGTSYIDNLVEGIVLCLDHAEAPGRTFHITDDVQVSWRELIEALAKALGVRPNLRSSPRWLAYPAAAVMEFLWRLFRRRHAPPLTRYRIRTSSSDLHFGNALAKQVLGYAPTVGLDEGIERTVASYREGRRTA